MKIAIISTPFIKCPPDAYGGAEAVTFSIATGLVELGHKVVLFAPRGSQVPKGGFLYETGEALNNVNVDWLESERKMSVVYLDKLSGFDVTLSSDWFGWSYSAKVDNPMLKMAHVHHGHISPFWLQSKPPFKLNFIAISKFMQNEYAGQGLTSRVCWNGIDLEKYPFNAYHASGRLLFIGRISQIKGVDKAIELAKRTGLGLDIVGGTSFISDQDKLYLEAIKKQCDSRQIVLYPDASHEKKIELLQQAKALIVCSQFSEPFGLMSVEGMASGCPVYALKDGAIPEVIQDGVTGFVCGSVDDMARKILDISKIVPESCRQRAEMLFSRKSMCLSYLKRFEEILAGDEW